MPECGHVHESGAPCTLLKQHRGRHQAFWRDRLIEWESVK